MGVTLRGQRGVSLSAAGLIAAVVALCAYAPAARADFTVIGDQTLTSHTPSLDSTGQNIPVFQGDAGSGYVLSSPKAGTITSWSFLSGASAPGKRFELAVLAPVDQNGQIWRLLATSDPQPVSSPLGTDAVQGPFATSIPVDVSERIALIPLDDTTVPVETGTGGIDGIRSFPAPFGSLGSSETVTSTADDGKLVPVQATVTFTGPPPAPQNTALPSISGTPTQYETLHGDPGLWINGVSSFREQWLRCLPDGSACSALPGEVSEFHTLGSDDVGFTLRFQVVASNQSGDSAPVVSAPSAVIARGAVSAVLKAVPNPSCPGTAVTFDGSLSRSPQGIRSYTFRVIDLYGVAVATLRFGGDPITETTVDGEMFDLGSGQASRNLDAAWGSDLFTTNQARLANLTETYTWNRVSLSQPAPSSPFGPLALTLVRDPVEVVLDVTDFAGNSARASVLVTFAQHFSTDSRAHCPGLKRAAAPNTALVSHHLTLTGSGQPQTTAQCQSAVQCVGSVSVIQGVLRAGAANVKRRALPVLASGFFSIAAHHRQKLTLTPTKLGKRKLHRGVRLRVSVVVSSVSATGRTHRRVYRQLLSG